MDLHSISSNLLLIGFLLISLCCLYLLYSNFIKVREIDDIKHKFDDLKKIFFNQQQHNDETYNKMLAMIKSSDNTTTSGTSGSSGISTTQLTVDNVQEHNTHTHQTEQILQQQSSPSVLTKMFMDLDISNSAKQQTVIVSKLDNPDKPFINVVIDNTNNLETVNTTVISNPKLIANIDDIDDIDDLDIDNIDVVVVDRPLMVVVER